MNVAIPVLVFLSLVAWPVGDSIAQPGPSVSAATNGAEQIVREWMLRGVIISESQQSAVFEHVPSGRQVNVPSGGTVAPSLTLVAVDADRVVLDGDGGARVTLRLGHGGTGHVVRRPVPAVRRVPPAAIGRRFVR
jgi:hypothetical protein